MNLKSSIRSLLEIGCTVKFPYKESINSWYGDVSISKLSSHIKTDVYIVQPLFTEIYDIDDAIDYFINIAFSSKNVGYIQKRLVDKGIDFEDYDLERPNEEVKSKFKAEAIIVDEEFKLFNINIKKLSKEVSL